MSCLSKIGCANTKNASLLKVSTITIAALTLRLLKFQVTLSFLQCLYTQNDH